MRYCLLFIVFLSCFVANTTAQSLKAYEKAADKAFATGDYNAAVYYYNYILKQDKTNKSVQLRYAECAVEMYAYPMAEKMLLALAKQKGATAALPNYHLALARAYAGQGKYNDAIKSYDVYLVQSTDEAKKTTAQQERTNSQWALTQPAPDALTTVTNPGKNLNSAYSDFAPALRGDTLYYSSYRFARKKNKGNPPKKWTKALVATPGGRGKEANRIFKDQDSVHVAHTAFFPNGHFMIYTQCRDQADASIRCDLYLTARDDRGRWLPGQRLPDGINAQGATTTQPQVAQGSDGSLTLYFASDRAGGQGKLDLYSMPLDSAWFCSCKAFSVKKPLVLPDFGAPQALTALNTPANDATPFYHAPTKTLYWSTDGRAGFGGYDVYQSPYPAQQPQPTNAGQPLNTSYHDLYYMVADSAARSGWMASNRLGSAYLNTNNKACCFDLYQWSRAEPPKPNTPVPTTPTDTIKPPQTDITSVPPLGSTPSGPQKAPTPPLQPPTPQEKMRSFVGLPLYFDNDEPDKRTRRSTTQKTYEATVSAYLAREEAYRQAWAGGARTEDQRAEAESEIASFFDDEVRRGYDRLFELTDFIFERLQAGERVEVFIKGYTSPRAQSDYNEQLGYRRISSVRNHFERWNDGVLKTYLSSGQIVVTQTSFGETTASTLASDRLEDEKNSIYNPVAARERRVEIVEIKTQ
jgi:tetratricopeptide (TPR) repeat protein